VSSNKKRELDAYTELKIEKTMGNLVSEGEIQEKIIIGIYDQDDQIVTTD
jgi:enterochelin esterase-like enzyme